MTFEQAATEYFKLGWVALALGLDGEGRPKRPLATAWTSIPHEAGAVRNQPWSSAQGIGLALGAASGGLAAIDIDDVELANATYHTLREHGVDTRMVWTIRRRIHVFVIEAVPSKSVSFKCWWRGKEVQIELKANGTQVATVPTPGYDLALDAPPLQVPTLQEAWLSICRKLQIEMPDKSAGFGGFPRPWQERVGKDERNKALYVEAHRLREAGIPYQAAVDIMTARFVSHYEQGGLDLPELERTVQSAYRKPIPSAINAEGDDETQYFR